MSKNRITYRNLGDIFVIEIEEKNIEVGTIEYYLAPFNKYVIIKNIYKYPERVKEYAEACQFTNAVWIVAASRNLKTFAPISNVIQEVITPALNESFKREITPTASSSSFAAEFSYHDPQVIEYHLNIEPHVDTGNWLPLHPDYPPLNNRPPEGKENIAGLVFLDETFGTEILINKNVSYYHSETTGLWRSPSWVQSNVNYFPEGSDSQYEHQITIGGEYNSAVFYYSALSHRPYFLGASDEDLKRGRLTQNIWFDDITEIKGQQN